MWCYLFVGWNMINCLLVVVFLFMLIEMVVLRLILLVGRLWMMFVSLMGLNDVMVVM